MRPGKFLLLFSLSAMIFLSCGGPRKVFLTPHPPSKAWTDVERNPQRVISFEEESVYDIEAKGFAYLRLGQLDKAEEYFKKALDMGEEEFSYLGLGMVEEKRGNLLQAYLYYMKSVHPEADKKLKEIKNRALSQALASSSPEEISKALIIDPQSKEAYIRLAQIYIAKGNYFLASAYVKKGLEALGDDPQLLLLYAKVLKMDGKIEDAIEVLKKLNSLYPSEESREMLFNLEEELERKRIKERLKPVMGKVILSRGDLALIIYAYFGDVLPEGRPPIITDLYRGEEMEAILKVTSAGLMRVYPDHTFLPDKTVNRLAFARIVFRVIRMLNIKFSSLSFPVLNDTNSYEARAMVGLGIMEAEGGNFKPYDTIKLEEAISAMEKLRKIYREGRVE